MFRRPKGHQGGRVGREDGQGGKGGGDGTEGGGYGGVGDGEGDGLSDVEFALRGVSLAAVTTQGEARTQC